MFPILSLAEETPSSISLENDNVINEDGDCDSETSDENNQEILEDDIYD